LKNFIIPVEKLISAFNKLPGVGRKTATRYAYAVINMSEDSAREFADAITNVKREVRYCSVCGNFTDREICQTCERGDRTLVCVVAEPKDVLAMERVTEFDGTYHVLHGLLNPLEGKTANDIRIKELLHRITQDGVREVIMATSPTVEGEATAIYVSNLIKPLGVRVTRIAQGVSMGTDIEYVDEVTLARAIEDRREI